MCAVAPLPQSICVVDDDESVRDSMRALLESYGIAVEEYASARDFLAHPEAGHSSCMLLDLHMPEMDGLQLLDTMRKQGSALPVIIITGRGDSQLSARAVQAGAYALLNKPVEDELLIENIRCAVASASGHVRDTSAAPR